MDFEARTEAWEEEVVVGGSFGKAVRVECGERGMGREVVEG